MNLFGVISSIGFLLLAGLEMGFAGYTHEEGGLH